MQTNFDRSLAAVLKHEGGWADHPSDPGGATMRGITLATYRAYLGRHVTKSELREIPEDHIADIYRTRYWDKVRGDDLPSGVDFAVFDAAVNSGPARAVMWLQRAVRAPEDGILGPDTMAKVRAANAGWVVEQVCEVRLAFLKRLKTWPVFGRGWERRVNEVRVMAKTLAGLWE